MACTLKYSASAKFALPSYWLIICLSVVVEIFNRLFTPPLAIRTVQPYSAQPSTSKHCAGTTTVECGVGPSTLGTWCSASSRATRTATSSLRRGSDHTSSRRCSDQAPISSRPSTMKSSSMPGTSNSYVAFTPNPCMYLQKLRIAFLKRKTLSLIGFAIVSSIFKWHPTPTMARGHASLEVW